VSTTIPGAGPVRAPTQDEPITLRVAGFNNEAPVLELLNVLLRRWQLVAGVPLVATALVVIVSFIIPATYTATTVFVPEARTQSRLPSNLATLAGQFGLPLGAEPSQSPRFYADVVRSRELLERLLTSEFPDPRTGAGTPASAPLLRILRVRGRDYADSLHRGVKKLNNLIAVSVDNQTSIIRLSVDARSPELAAAAANRLVQYLNEFNAKTRQSQARERRNFVEERVSAAGEELRQGEEAVKTFYERNHFWQQAPELVFEEGRLRRQVTVSQQVYLTLRQEYESARIEEVNDTPVFTIIDPAVPPQERSQPERSLWAVLALALSTMISVSWAFGAGYLERARRDAEPEYREFLGLLGRARRELARAVPRLFRSRRVS